MPATPVAFRIPQIGQCCRRCVMDTTDPDIRFDESGLCSHCREWDRIVQRWVYAGPEGERRTAQLVDEIRRAGKGRTYDCVIGVSGGVDSTFVAWKVKQLGLRPLAVHLDNGWDSELAVRNIEHTLKRLSIDLYTHVLDWEEFRDLQVAFLKASTPDAEVPTDHAIFSLMRQSAWRLGVSHVVAGVNHRTESHLPRAWSQGHMDWRYIRSVHRRFGAVPLRTFPHLSFTRLNWYRVTQRWVDILNYGDYSKKLALEVLERELGWQYYGAKHFESIYTRWYQGWYLPRKFGFDKRRSHLSSLVCAGELTRGQALAELEREPYSRAKQEEDRTYVIKKLGLDEERFEALMRLPKKSYWDYPSYGRIYAHPLAQKLRDFYHARVR